MTGTNNRSKEFIGKHLKILVCLFLVIATFAVYWQVHRFDFVSFDDDDYVYENRHVQEGLTLESITWAFTTIHAGNWHPLTWLSHILGYQFYGMNSGLHHLTNLFFHIANTLLLFFVFTKMTDSLWQSAFVAALFALHPCHVGSVAWVSERKDVLSTFFWMLTMWSYIRYVEHPAVNRYLWVVLCFTLGLMSKPMLVTLPFVLLLLDYWPLNRLQIDQAGIIGNSQQRSIALNLVWEKVPLFALVAISSVVTFYAQKQGGLVVSLDVIPFNDRAANALVAYVKYIGKMIYPAKRAALYPHTGMLPWWQITGACLLLVSISFVAIKTLKQGRLYQTREDLNAAADEYQKALLIEPEFVEALNNLASIYMTKNENDKALSLLNRLAALQPDNAGHYYNLARVYAIKNLTQESIGWLNKAIAKGYNNWNMIKTDKDLENIRGSADFKALIKDK